MLPKSEFSRNVLKVMTGTTFAQVLPIAVAPILTRLFSPEEFGVYYLYSSIVAMLVVIASGKYDLAILIPNEEKKALNITALSGWICTLFSLFLFFLFYLFGEKIALFLNEPKVRPWLYWIPFSVFVQGWFNVLNTWHNRNKRFGLLTVSRFLMGGGNAGYRVGLGYFNFGVGGLVLGTVGAQFTALLAFIYSFLKKDKKKLSLINCEEMKKAQKRFAHFPKKMILGSLFFKGGTEIPNILFNSFFAATIAGFFGQMQAVIRRPLQVIGKAFEEVFKQKASEELQTFGHCKNIFFKTTKRLALIGFLPFLFFGIIAPSLFAFVFGEDWREAGLYAQIFTLPFYFNFITAPLSSVFYLQEKPGTYTLLEALQLLLTTIAFVIGYLYFKNAKAVVVLMALSFTIIQIIRYFILVKIVNEEKNI